MTTNTEGPRLMCYFTIQYINEQQLSHKMKTKMHASLGNEHNTCIVILQQSFPPSVTAEAVFLQARCPP